MGRSAHGAAGALGAGLGFRGFLAGDIVEHVDELDWIELLTEEFLPLTAGRRALVEELTALFPCVLHGTELSIGGTASIDTAYVAQVAELAEMSSARWFSDHLCSTAAGDLRFGDLGPIQWTHRAAAMIAERATWTARTVGLPFLLENISYSVVIPGEMTEAQFINAVLEESDCFLLLDVANVYANSINFGFEPIEFLESLPLDRVRQLHVAGGSWEGAFRADSHDSVVPDDVWALAQWVVDRAAVPAVLVERDDRFPPDFGDLVDEVGRARRMLDGQSARP
jgi:uncharacterized protein